MEPKLILYGASGHCKVIIDILESVGRRPDEIWDDVPKAAHIYNYMVVATDDADKRAPSVLIVSIGDNSSRKSVVEKLGLDAQFSLAIDAHATVSGRTEIGSGTVVMAGAIINADARIGRHCIVNTGATVDHDCIIHDYVHISPNATLCGNVEIGVGTHVGAGSVIIPGVRVGNWCKIGAGAVVIRDVADHSTVVGNPAKIVKK